MSDALVLSDVAQIFDGPHATPSRIAEGPYFLNIASLGAGRLDLTQSDHVSEDDFALWTRRVQPREGDVLFSYETRLGEAAVMPADLRACLGRRMALLRPDPERVLPRYLLYYYLGPEFQALIEQNTIHGATVNRIGLATMGQWPVRLPPIPKQKAVVEILGAIDDKISSNSELVRRCESLARGFFESALAGASKLPLTHLAQFVNGKAFTKNATGSGRVVVRIAELNSGVRESAVRNDIEVPHRHLARPGDLLFSWSGSLVVKRWFYPEAIINQHIFKVIPVKPYPAWLVYQLLVSHLEHFRGIAADKATTMGHIQRHHLEEEIDVPSTLNIDRVNPLMGDLWSRALAAEQESLTLAALRDTLLPELMSGRLRVRDAEEQVGEVL